MLPGAQPLAERPSHSGDSCGQRQTNAEDVQGFHFGLSCPNALASGDSAERGNFAQQFVTLSL